jgi:hypothetical protein
MLAERLLAVCAVRLVLTNYAKLSLFSYLRDSPAFVEPYGSLLCSEEPATGPYPEPGECNQNPYTSF